MIVETGRGPSIAGRRITVYIILDHLQSGVDREFIKEHLVLSDEELDAAIEYIEAHRDAIERDYAEIRRRSDERREHYEQLYRERSRLDPNLPLQQRVALMRRDLSHFTISISPTMPAIRTSGDAARKNAFCSSPITATEPTKPRCKPPSRERTHRRLCRSSRFQASRSFALLTTASRQPTNWPRSFSIWRTTSASAESISPNPVRHAESVGRCRLQNN
jgi:uncharacterized protein (DUF433 family)